MKTADRARPWHIPLSSLGPLANRLIRYGLALLVLAVIFSGAIAWLIESNRPSLRTSLIIMAVFAVANTVLQPVMIWIAMRLWAWTFPIVSFVLNGAMVLLASDFMMSWQLDNL